MPILVFYGMVSFMVNFIIVMLSCKNICIYYYVYLPYNPWGFLNSDSNNIMHQIFSQTCYLGIVHHEYDYLTDIVYKILYELSPDLYFAARWSIGLKPHVLQTLGLISIYISPCWSSS